MTRESKIKELCDDPYIRYVKDVRAPIGMSVIDAARTQPGPSIVRGYDTGVKKEERIYPRDKDELLCRGAAVGVSEDGICRHIWPHFAPQKPLGFVVANLDGDKVLVVTYGAVFLIISGIVPADQGKPVYALGPNTFTLEKQRALVEIGIVRFIQLDALDMACVAFKRFDSPEKLETLRRR